jgi:hypothetical protein
MADGKLKAAPIIKGAGIEKLHGNTSTVEHTQGDLEAGRGFVALRDAFDETALWCLDVNRRADGVWRVQNVKKTKTCGGQRRRKVD